MKATARLPFEKVRFDVPFRTHLVVSLDAPSVDWETKRQPVCVIPVIDVSGSMAGAKLDRVKKSVQKLVDHLSPGDFCGVVTFTTGVEVVSPPVQMSAARKEAVKAAVAQLRDQGSTNLAGGMLEGLRLANGSSLPEGMRVRVILFTDGLPNAGIATASEQLLPLLGEHLGRATLSAFGYGDDADQELLRDLSTRGKGNYAFVAGPDDAMTAFARELGGLLSTYAENIVIDVRSTRGNAVTSVLSDVDATPAGRGVRVTIPDILGEETRHVVVAVELGPVDEPSGSAETAFEVEVTFEVLGEKMRATTKQISLHASVERVLSRSTQRTPAPDLDVIVAQAELIRAQIEAEELARRGHHEQAYKRVFVLFQEMTDRGHPAVASAARAVAATMRDAEEFQVSRAYRSSMRKGMGRSSAIMMDEEASKSLKSMGFDKQTSAQEKMEGRFKEGDSSSRKKDASERKPPTGPRPTRARRW